MNADLERQLRHLRLSGFIHALPIRNQEAISNNLAYVEFLELLVHDELERRRQLLFQRRLKQAQLPQVRSLDTFDWSFNPQIPKALILDLATCRFVADHAGILILGPPGTGKSHIAISLACAAIEAGYTVLYRSAFDLAQDFAEATATDSRKQLVQQLLRSDLTYPSTGRRTRATGRLPAASSSFACSASSQQPRSHAATMPFSTSNR